MRKILTIICTLFSLLQLHSQTEQDIISEANRLKISSRQEAISALSDKGISESQAKEMAQIRGIDFEAFLEQYLKDVQNIEYVTSKYEVLNNVDALVLLTEWKEFRSPDFEEMKLQLKNPIIFDGRNQYNAFNLDEKGFEYEQIGK